MITTVKNEKLIQWIKEVATVCSPDALYVCNGSNEEYNLMMGRLLASGSAIPIMWLCSSLLPLHT